LTHALSANLDYISQQIQNAFKTVETNFIKEDFHHLPVYLALMLIAYPAHLKTFARSASKVWLFLTTLA
jgi:hypothetical protein